jgi:phage pi2 protein 07
MEDPNEASVFARTYAFSLKFYRKYPKANPARDSNFTALYSLLGNPLNPGAVNKLNELIEQYYGKAMSITSAEEKAKQEIGYKNMNILWHNKEEKWCPEVKYPLLNKKEDEANAKMIAEIIIRYAQVPRSIKQQELAGYSSSFMPVANEWYQDWRYWEVEQFNPSVKKNEEREITFYPSWKTFKEWCLQAEHIKKYVDKEYEGKIQEAAGRVIAEKVDEKTSANDIALENLKKLIGENFGENIE